MRLSHAAVILVSGSEADDLQLLLTKKSYLETVHEWWKTYRGMSIGGGAK
jgi:hypothetical protein